MKAFIHTLSHISRVKIPFLYYIANNTLKFYQIYYIPKRNGKFRRIEAPLPILRHIQRVILQDTLPRRIHFIATGFRDRYSIRDNAEIHCNQKVIVTIDIKNVFSSIQYNRIFSFYRRQNMSESTATLFTKLCTINGHLPQGAPTSPLLSNLIQFNFDNSLYSYCASRNIAVTRYADDITFSGNINSYDIKSVINYTERKLKNIKLTINKEKTRILKNYDQQRVTGLVVNKKINVPRKLRRELRQTMYYLMKYGEIDRRPPCQKDLNSLLGKINFVCSIDALNTEFKLYKRHVIKLIHIYRKNDTKNI